MKKSRMATRMKNIRKSHSDDIRYHSLPLRFVICLNMSCFVYAVATVCVLFLSFGRGWLSGHFNVCPQALQISDHGDDLAIGADLYLVRSEVCRNPVSLF